MSGHIHNEEDWLTDAEKREQYFENECERVLMETYGYLNKVQDFLPQVSHHPKPGTHHCVQEKCGASPLEECASSQEAAPRTSNVTPFFSRCL